MQKNFLRCLRSDTIRAIPKRGTSHGEESCEEGEAREESRQEEEVTWPEPNPENQS
jgi:hypothetical protein